MRANDRRPVSPSAPRSCCASIACLCRKIAMTRLRPTADSAAASAITRKKSTWPSGGRPDARERDERERGGVQQDLDRQEDHEQVPAREDAEDADREQDGGDGEVGARLHGSVSRSDASWRS